MHLCFFLHGPGADPELRGGPLIWTLMGGGIFFGQIILFVENLSRIIFFNLRGLAHEGQTPARLFCSLTVGARLFFPLKIQSQIICLGKSSCPPSKLNGPPLTVAWTPFKLPVFYRINMSKPPKAPPLDLALPYHNLSFIWFHDLSQIFLKGTYSNVICGAL